MKPLLPYFPVNDIVRRKLKEARRRLVLGEFLQHVVWALLAGFAVLFCLRAFAPVHPSPALWLILPTLPLAALLVLAIWRWRKPRTVAIELDARGRTKDRFLTALRLERGAAPFGDAALREVSDFAAACSPRKHLPLRVDPGRFLWLLVPLAAWLALGAWQEAGRSALQPDLAAAQSLLEQTRRLAEDAKDQPTREAVEELKRNEERLKSSSDPLRDALRALADFERRLAQSADALSAQDMADLADALAGASPDASEALRAGRQGEASDKIAQMDPEALKQALQQAEKHLQNSRLREMLRQAAGQMQRRLAQMVQSSGQGDPGDARRLRAMVRDLKNGSGQGQPDQQQAGGGEEGLPADNPPGKEKSTAGRGDDAPPGGGPGSEKDFGQGKPLDGGKNPGEGEGNEAFVAGQMGDGTSLVQAFRSSGNLESGAGRAYRNAYDTAASAALDSVNREEIAPGSRFLVRRYFESIRPKE